MSKTYKRFSKERIEDGELNISVVEKEHQASLVLTLKVKNYSKLKKRFFYYKAAKSPDHRWRIELGRDKGTLFVILCTKKALDRRVNFSIDSIDRTKITERTAENIGRLVYVSEYCNRAILDPENKFLTDDVLTVKCIYDIHPLESSCLLFRKHKSFIQSYDQGDLNYNKYIYMTAFCADFTIILTDGSIRVHKLILCMHSKFLFAKLQMEDSNGYHRQEYKIDTVSYIMDRVFLHVYCEELKEMNDQCRTEMIRVARLLEIDSLIDVLKRKIITK